MTRVARLARFALVLFYGATLIVAAWPRLLSPPGDAARWLGFGANLLLQQAAIVPGLEVFNAVSLPRDVPHMACFRVRGFGPGGPLTLYDDLDRCANRQVSYFRDPFRAFQHRKLSAALVHLDLGGHGDLTRPPLRDLFLFTEYYCHREDARKASVQRIEIVSEFLTLTYANGSLGRHPMGGTRRCDSPRWTVLEHVG